MEVLLLYFGFKILFAPKLFVKHSRKFSLQWHKKQTKKTTTSQASFSISVASLSAKSASFKAPTRKSCWTTFKRQQRPWQHGLRYEGMSPPLIGPNLCQTLDCTKHAYIKHVFTATTPKVSQTVVWMINIAGGGRAQVPFILFFGGDLWNGVSRRIGNISGEHFVSPKLEIAPRWRRRPLGWDDWPCPPWRWLASSPSEYVSNSSLA